jgi:hypothetical protein
MKTPRKTIKKLATVINSATLFFYSAIPAKAATATGWSGVCVSTRDSDVATIQGFQCLIARVFSYFLTMVGIVAFLMFVVSGVRILLSGGNSQAVEKSKSSITFAVIGLVAALSAFIILNLIAEFTGVDTILNFWIPDSGHSW